MATLGNPTNTIAVLQKYQYLFQKKYGQKNNIEENILEKNIDFGQGLFGLFLYQVK